MAEKCIAKVAVSKAIYVIDKPYDYVVPSELADRICPGMRVLVPFGSGNRPCDGIVLALTSQEDGPSLKHVISLLDEEAVLNKKLLKLALWMRERCFCTVYDAVKAMLPAGLYFSLRDCCSLKESVSREEAYEACGQSAGAKKLLELLFACGGKADMEQVRGAFGTKSPTAAIKLLSDKGIIDIETSAMRAVNDKTRQVAVLAIPAEEALAQVAPRRKSAPLRYAVVELLCAMGSAGVKELCYFTGASSATLRSLAQKGIITLEKQEVLRRVEQEEVEPAGPVLLNEEQSVAFERLDGLARSDKPGAALLYGVTGSGKTQVYIKLIQKTLERGRSAMVLVPEIALTPQLLRIFTSHFGQQIAVLHSSLRAGERYDEWKRVRSGEARVVIGTRSAVFAPLSDIGLIVLDEEQEGSYKSENTPRYHARDVAKYRCAQENALLVLGSATPSVETMYHASRGQYELIRLTHRYNQKALPQVFVADMKEELRQGNGTSISTDLRMELEYNLAKGEQSILFLNRRGASRMVSCGECGHVPECPRCSTHLTYHSANGRLMCHYCGHSQRLPQGCPECGGMLNFIGIGTQKVQEELEELFPGTEILRMDTDTVTAAHPHEYFLDRFRKEKIPILLGTQMVAKGLDFENVTLVGVIAADLSLFVEDFRGGERTFSLLTQVVGRAGRGEKTGRAVIQTYTPEHEVIRFAAKQDYDSFYEQEISLRKLRGFPPFQDITVLTVSGPDEGVVLRVCAKLRMGLEQGLEKLGEKTRVLGPAPAVITKVNNRYRYRLTLAGTSTPGQRHLISHLLRAVHQDKECRGVSAFADINPFD
ncbi:MAG: primosomal protein N' [Ruminococcaceae bacterium]|nr:primosomal protein N' [Oscillospiraceae bacterium]